MKKDYKVYLFDFDGCLVDTMKAMEFIFLESLKQCGLSAKKEEVVQFVRQPLPVTFKQKGGEDKDFSTFDYWINVYLKDEKATLDSELFPDVLPLLKKLKAQNKVVGIVTSNNAPHVREVMNYLKVDLSIFDVIVGNQESKIHKPNPDPVLKALEMLNYKGNINDVIYVGDALDDVKAGKSAGVEYCLLDRFDEYGNYQEEKIKSLMELIDE